MTFKFSVSLQCYQVCSAHCQSKLKAAAGEPPVETGVKCVQTSVSRDVDTVSHTSEQCCETPALCKADSIEMSGSSFTSPIQTAFFYMHLSTLSDAQTCNFGVLFKDSLTCVNVVNASAVE